MIDTAHHTDFNDTSKLGKAMGYMDCLVKEAIEVWLYPDNFNRDKGFNLCHMWRPITNMLQQSTCMPMGKEGQAELGT
jgi:hypothetical protein